MALTKITSDVIETGAVESTHIASGAISSSHLTGITTDNVSEGSTNTYFTNARARGSVSVTGGGLSYDSGTGVIQIGSIPNASLTNSSLTVNSNSVSLGGSVTLDTDDIGEGSSNLYFTNARAQGAISGGTGVTVSGGAISIGQDVATSSTPTFGNITTTGYIAGPATFTIDPAAVGDNTGTVVIAGDLQVDGTTTTINSTTVNIDDLNIQLATGAINAAAANGAGITVDGASATITYDGTNDEWDFNKDIKILGPTNANGPRFYMMEDSNNGAFIKYDGSTNEGELGGLTSSSENTVMTWSRSASKVVFNENSLDMDFRVESNGNANMLFIDGGNNKVGIGTDSPDTLLELFADNPVLRLRDSKVKGSSWAAGDALGGLEFYTSDTTGIGTHTVASIKVVNGGQAVQSPDGEIVFSTGAYNTAASEAMRIDSSGNLLVGKTSDDGTAGVRIGGSGTIVPIASGIPIIADRLSSDGEIIRFRKDGGTVGSIGTNNGSLFIVGDTSSGNGAGLKFIDGSTERIVPATSGGGEVDNLVDLGQSTHRFKDLYLSGAANVGGVEVSDTDDIRLRFLNGATFKAGIQVATTAGDMIATSSVDDLAIRSQSNMLFATGGNTERMRITANGNLQMIGQTSSFESPGFTYHTNNYLYLRGGSSGLILSDDSGINTIQIIDGSSGYINFETGNGSSKMRIKSNGNVGIGETGPEYRLQVDGTNVLSGGGLANLCLVDRTAYNGTLPGAGITFRGEYTSGGNTTNFATIQGIKENTSSGNYAAALRFTTRANGGNLTERMRIDSSGNVGIGTSSPGDNHAKANNLVVGSGSAGGIAVYNGTSEGWYAFSRDNANNTDAYDGGISYDGSRNLRLHTNAGGVRLKIDGTGDTEIYGHLSFEDNKLLMFGGGQDARLYFDASTNALFITAANGTANTINMTTNNFSIGGANALISGTANDSVVINQDGASNVDFRVESDNEQYNFFCDASSEIIHFGEGTNSDVQSVIPARTLAGRRHGYHGGNKQHAGQTFKYSETTTWTDAIKIDWHNVSWGAVCMRITGQYYYSASENFSIVIGFQGYGEVGSSTYGHNSVSYDATSSGSGTWTDAIQLAQTAVGETMIRQRAGDTTGDIIYRYEWQCYARSNQPILIIEQ